MHHARPHLSVHSRNKSHSAVAGAAYRMRMRLFDDRTQRWHDHHARTASSRVVKAKTLAPEGSPAWAFDPAQLWNIVEAAERRRDAQVARDYRIPVPLGVSEEAAVDLAEMMGQFIVRELSTAVSFGVHRDEANDAFGRAKTDAERGYHVHLYFPTRSIPKQDNAATSIPRMGPKLRQFAGPVNGAAFIERLNEKWAELANLVAGRGGLATTYDHRSYKRMGLDRDPEPKLGQAASAQERQGRRTPQGDRVRAHRAARRRHTDLPPAVIAPNAVGDDPFSVPQAREEGMSVDGPAARPAVASSPVPFPADGGQHPIIVPTMAMATPPSSHRPLAAVTPQRSVAVERADGLTREQWRQSPVAWEPLPVVGLARRFEAADAARAKAAGVPINPVVHARVHAIERALNALIQVGRALLHLDKDYKRYANARVDARLDAEKKRDALEALRHEADTARRPYTPKMRAAYRARQAQLQALEADVRDRHRISLSIDEQLKAIEDRANPWRHQAIQDRRRVKQALVALREADADAVDVLLAVSNESERPWIALYSSQTEPTMSLQKLVDTIEEGERTVDRTTQRKHRPKM